MNNESKTPRNVCVLRLLKGVGGMTRKATTQEESWDPGLGHQLPVKNTGLLKLFHVLER